MRRISGIVLVAALGIVSSQAPANLGIFNVTFDIVLTNHTGEDDVTMTLASSLTTTAITTSSATTSAAVDKTQPRQDPGTINRQLFAKLIKVFAKTTAYLATSMPNETTSTSRTLTYRYNIVYNKTLLNVLSLLHENSTLIQQLWNATDVIVASDTNFTDGFVVDEKATEYAMMGSIELVNKYFASESWLCIGAVCTEPRSGCSLNGSSKTVVCSDKCVQFEAGNYCTRDPSAPGVYVRGTCKVDANGNAYCDCGKSTGDVMNNFFDGSQCVSVTFIVAMAASAGGFFFLLWLIALCAICGLKGSKGNDSLRESSTEAFTTYNGYNEAHTGLEMERRTYSTDYVSSQDGPSSTRNNNANDVTRQGADEIKSIRL